MVDSWLEVGNWSFHVDFDDGCLLAHECVFCGFLSVFLWLPVFAKSHHPLKFHSILLELSLIERELFLRELVFHTRLLSWKSCKNIDLETPCGTVRQHDLFGSGFRVSSFLKLENEKKQKLWLTHRLNFLSGKVQLNEWCEQHFLVFPLVARSDKNRLIDWPRRNCFPTATWTFHQTTVFFFIINGRREEEYNNHHDHHHNG